MRNFHLYVIWIFVFFVAFYVNGQPLVSSVSVNLTTETAIVWPVSEAKTAPNWQKQLGKTLAEHLSSCGFNSNLRGIFYGHIHSVFFLYILVKKILAYGRLFSSMFKAYCKLQQGLALLLTDDLVPSICIILVQIACLVDYYYCYYSLPSFYCVIRSHPGPSCLIDVLGMPVNSLLKK